MSPERPIYRRRKTRFVLANAILWYWDLRSMGKLLDIADLDKAARAVTETNNMRWVYFGIPGVLG